MNAWNGVTPFVRRFRGAAVHRNRKARGALGRRARARPQRTAQRSVVANAGRTQSFGVFAQEPGGPTEEELSSGGSCRVIDFALHRFCHSGACLRVVPKASKRRFGTSRSLDASL